MVGGRAQRANKYRQATTTVYDLHIFRGEHHRRFAKPKIVLIQFAVRVVTLTNHHGPPAHLLRLPEQSPSPWGFITTDCTPTSLLLLIII